MLGGDRIFKFQNDVLATQQIILLDPPATIPPSHLPLAPDPTMLCICAGTTGRK